MTPKLIDSHFAVKACPKCGKPIEAGARVWYDADAPRGKKSWHQACGQDQQTPVPAPVPMPEYNGDLPRAVKNGNRVSLRLDGFAQLAAYVARDWGSLPKCGDARQQYNEKRTQPGGAWYGMTGDTKEPPVALSVRLAMEGWQEGAERIAGLIASMPDLPAPTSTKRRRRNAEFGDTCDMGRVWAGDLDHAWTICQRQSRHAPQPITIAVHHGCPGGEVSDVLAWRAVAAITLADKLTQAGYSVAIVAYWLAGYCVAGETAPTDCDFRLTLKHHNAPLDVATAAAMLAHPSSIRGAAYAAYYRMAGETGTEVDSGLTRGYGRNDETIDAEMGRTIHLGRDVATNPEKAAQWLADTIAPFVEMPLAA